MGIRYYAYPVAAELVPQAQHDPYLFLSHDPLMDAWGPEEDRPQMLYLDKCWGLLQALTGPEPGDEPRPAFRLFEGEVEFTDSSQGEWYAWTRVLTADDVQDIARDLVQVDDDDIKSMMNSHPRFDRANDEDYLRHYLVVAQKFMIDLAAKGFGLVYKIG